MSEHAAVELSPEAIAFADWLATGQNPASELDAARIQAEQVHLAAREPEGVTYREVDAGGVLGIWCEPVGSNTDYVPPAHSRRRLRAGVSTRRPKARRPYRQGRRRPRTGTELPAGTGAQVPGSGGRRGGGLQLAARSWGTYEVLAGEDDEFATRVKDAGIDTTSVVVPGGQHSYVYGAGRIPETDAAIAQISAWVREKTKI